MNHRLLLSFGCILFLVLLATSPVMAATVLCPSGCSCMSPAEAQKAGNVKYCGGTQQICAADAQDNKKYCYARVTPTTTTPVVPAIIVTGYHVLTTTPATSACPAGCSCYTLEDGKKKGLDLCGGKKTLCGYTANSLPEYCHGTPLTVPPAGAAAAAPITVTTTPLLMQAVPAIAVTTTGSPADNRVFATQRCTISGRINGFWHNRSSLRVRVTPEGGTPTDVYTFPEEGPADSVTPVLTYLSIVPCTGGPWEIEPVYVPDENVCPWTGTFAPARITGVRTNGSSITGLDFTFSRTDTRVPGVEISFSPPAPGVGEAASVIVQASDDTGITAMTAVTEWHRRDGSVEVYTPTLNPAEGAPEGALRTWSDTLYFGAPWYTNLDRVYVSAKACDAAGNEGRDTATLVPGSCDDNFMNRDEEQIDCGGSHCAPCPPCTWCNTSVHALQIRGDTADKIDVIFVPEEDYDGDMRRFIADIQNTISLGYYRNTAIGLNRSKFNFYYMTEEAEMTPAATATFTPPHGSCDDFQGDTSFAESVAIVHTEDFRDWSGTRCGKRIFSSEPTSYRTFVHESGHSVLGLKDEYCCDSSYRQNDPNPNIWGSRSNCTSDASGMGWSTTDCSNFCPSGSGDCGTGYWDNDPAWCIMTCSQDCDAASLAHCAGGMCQFEHACDRRVDYVFSQYP